MIAERLGVKRYTLASWVYRKRITSDSKIRVKLAFSGTDFMNKEAMSPKAQDARIKELERQLALEKVHSACFEKMIDIDRHQKKMAPNMLWVSDITYIEIKDDVSYFSLITDACSHKIVVPGHCARQRRLRL